jgi:hypothetical protein
VLSSVPSPRVWPRAVTSLVPPGLQEAGRFGPLVLRLVRKDCHQQAGQVNLSNARGGLVGPHERAITGSKKELCIDERTEQRVARRPIEAP